MSAYIPVLLQACFVFPIIAFVFSLPYILFNYHKYGSFLSMRIAIVYSFILYLICAYFLVILPLPSIEEVAKMTQPATQLQLFRFLQDISETTSFSISDVFTYLPTLSSSTVYQVLFNFALTMPFGMYLRYYFQCDVKKTLLFSFLLALFFELTQLSGLYGIYPRSYRIFDVDDLLINTIGGMLGFALMKPLMKVLPTRKEIDEKSYHRGMEVSLPRRMTAFLLDSFIVLSFSLFVQYLLQRLTLSLPFLFVYVYVFYFIFITLLTKGASIGKKITKIKVVSTNNDTTKSYQYGLRYLLLYGFVFVVPSLLYQSLFDAYTNNALTLNAYFLFVGFIVAVLIIYLCFAMIEIATDKTLFYERLSKTKIMSTIPLQEAFGEATKQETETKEDLNNEQTNTVL